LSAGWLGDWTVGKLPVGSWQLAVGSWQLAVGSWQLAFDRRMAIHNFPAAKATLFFPSRIKCAGPKTVKFQPEQIFRKLF
jgi:hypothetical protein